MVAILIRELDVVVTQQRTKKWSPYWYFEEEYKAPKVLSNWTPLWDSDFANGAYIHEAIPTVVPYQPSTGAAQKEKLTTEYKFQNPL